MCTLSFWDIYIDLLCLSCQIKAVSIKIVLCKKRVDKLKQGSVVVVLCFLVFFALDRLQRADQILFSYSTQHSQCI